MLSAIGIGAAGDGDMAGALEVPVVLASGQRDGGPCDRPVLCAYVRHPLKPERLSARARYLLVNYFGHNRRMTAEGSGAV